MDHRQAVSYESFCKSKSYRAMWTKEKKRLEELHVEGILPVIAGEELVAVTLISSDGSERKKKPCLHGKHGFHGVCRRGIFHCAEQCRTV